ncbi:hypothetical protein I532_01570 [Brevibacillus borstelensis AK1]|uniref:Peptidase C39-like domain-containing protein n=1 Tax=Brevibacillus borstelensis AK1 TaxID=1300222 RepID=M8DD65_9BACL|nr:papain-like cysteine protease family protein [Brevibacillus borstelensis]EMT54254.1 hypothetical protein I532_01570 [Brevibacillus borstelensis AK1]
MTFLARYKNWLALFIIPFLLLIPSQSTSAATNVTKELPMKFESQEKTNWCWAAMSVMMLKYYYNTNITQTEYAEYVLERNTGLNEQITFLTFQVKLRGKGIDGSSYGGPISFAKIKENIDANKPIVISFVKSNNVGHMQLIYGYSEIDGVKYVHYFDPAGGHKLTMKWSEFLNRDIDWLDTLYDTYKTK